LAELGLVTLSSTQRNLFDLIPNFSSTILTALTCSFVLKFGTPIALRSREVPVVLDAMQTHGKLAWPDFRPEVGNQKCSLNSSVSKFFPKYCSLSLFCPKPPQKHVAKLLGVMFLHLSCKKTVVIYGEGITFGHIAWWQCSVPPLQRQPVLVMVLSPLPGELLLHYQPELGTPLRLQQ